MSEEPKYELQHVNETGDVLRMILCGTWDEAAAEAEKLQYGYWQNPNEFTLNPGFIIKAVRP